MKKIAGRDFKVIVLLSIQTNNSKIKVNQQKSVRFALKFSLAFQNNLSNNRNSINMDKCAGNKIEICHLN